MKSLISWAILAVTLAGCASNPQPSAASDPSWTGNYSSWGKDPVAGRMIRKSAALANRQYEGSTYYFLSGAEAEKFDSNPAFFAAAAQAIPNGSPEHTINSKVR